MQTKHAVISSPSFAAAGVERTLLSAIGWIGAIVQYVAEANRRRQDYAHLESLPNYLLADIGVTRWEIREVGRRSSLPYLN